MLEHQQQNQSLSAIARLLAGPASRDPEYRPAPSLKLRGVTGAWLASRFSPTHTPAKINGITTDPSGFDMHQRVQRHPPSIVSRRIAQRIATYACALLMHENANISTTIWNTINTNSCWVIPPVYLLAELSGPTRFILSHHRPSRSKIGLRSSRYAPR